VVKKTICAAPDLGPSITCDHGRLAPPGLGPDEAPLTIKSIGERRRMECKGAKWRIVYLPLEGLPFYLKTRKGGQVVRNGSSRLGDR